MTFKCRPLSATLTRAQCASLHVTAERARNGVGRSSGSTNACDRCAVGKAHSLGETPTHWPDDEPIVLLGSLRRGELSAAPPSAPLALTAPRAPLSSAGGKVYRHKGTSLTIAGWARKLGISYDALRWRIRKHHTLAAAISMGGPGGRLADARRRRAAATLRVERALRRAGFVVLDVVEADGELVARCAR